ncbi:hypothetical protein HOY80DRAFT_984017 [Tuber brumale]|nr:hypothetical protein HOY80DRAFT_984017 [Tuber brumale]
MIGSFILYFPLLEIFADPVSPLYPFRSFQLAFWLHFDCGDRAERGEKSATDLIRSFRSGVLALLPSVSYHT